jgi:hypothetical protein
MISCNMTGRVATSRMIPVMTREGRMLDCIFRIDLWNP